MAVAVQQADRKAVELGFAAVINCGAVAEQIAGRQVQAFNHTAVEFTQVVFLEGIPEAEHRHFVAYLAERRQRRATDALGRRVSGHQLRVFGFQGLEFVEQAIVFGVRHARLIEHVVAVVVLIELGTQFKNSGFGGHGV
ncbi:hypothetical protein D3C81_1115600 [compost metagenome]